MLLSFLLADKDAIGFFKRKFKQYKETNGFDFQKFKILKLNYKVGPITGPEMVGSGEDAIVPADNAAACDEVISIENED